MPLILRVSTFSCMNLRKAIILSFLHSFWEVAVCLERNGASCGTLWAGMFLNLTASPKEKEAKNFGVVFFVVVFFSFWNLFFSIYIFNIFLLLLVFVLFVVCFVFIHWPPLNSVWIDSRCHVGFGGAVFVHGRYLMKLVVFVRLRGKWRSWWMWEEMLQRLHPGVLLTQSWSQDSWKEDRGPRLKWMGKQMIR